MTDPVPQITTRRQRREIAVQFHTFGYLVTLWNDPDTGEVRRVAVDTTPAEQSPEIFEATHGTLRTDHQHLTQLLRPVAPPPEQPITDMAALQAALNEAYSDPQVAAASGTGKGLPAIRPGKLTLTYDEALEWIADQQPRPERPDPQAVAMLRQVRKLIDKFKPAVARVVLQLIAPGSEEWTPEMIAAAPPDQLKEMVEAAAECLIVRLQQPPDDEPPESPPADRMPPPSPPDRRQELREDRVDEVRGPPSATPPESRHHQLINGGNHHLDHAGSTPPAILPTWTSLDSFLRRMLARLGGGGAP
jgi:hypothetical protein